MVARHESTAHAIPLGSVFPASFVLHTLRLLQNYDLVKPLVDAIVNFVLKERGPNGLWRGFSSPTLPPDCDTTSCVLASLKEWNATLDCGLFIRRLLLCQLDGGAFFTFVPTTDPRIVLLQKDIDWVVNANVLFFFFSAVGYALPKVEAYLEEAVALDLFTRGSKWYPSPFAFTYCLSRAVVDGEARNLARLLYTLSSYVCSAQELGGIWIPAGNRRGAGHPGELRR